MARTWEHLEWYQFLPKNPGDPKYSLSKWDKMSDDELRAEARRMAKQSNQRLVRLEKSGMTSSEAYKRAMANLSGMYEKGSDGHASYANKKGTRFIENTKNMSRFTAIRMLEQMSYHLRRASTEGQQNSIDRARKNGMELAMLQATVATRDPKVKKALQEFSGSLDDLFSSSAYKVLDKMYKYKTALQTIISRPEVFNSKTVKTLIEEILTATETGNETDRKLAEQRLADYLFNQSI